MENGVLYLSFEAATIRVPNTILWLCTEWNQYANDVEHDFSLRSDSTARPIRMTDARFIRTKLIRLLHTILSYIKRDPIESFGIFSHSTKNLIARSCVPRLANCPHPKCAPCRSWLRYGWRHHRWNRIKSIYARTKVPNASDAWNTLHRRWCKVAAATAGDDVDDNEDGKDDSSFRWCNAHFAVAQPKSNENANAQRDVRLICGSRHGPENSMHGCMILAVDSRANVDKSR